jgi:Zn-dependent peptidase ImmA (M78 family)
MMPEVAREDLAIALDSVGAEALSSAEVHHPPVDAVSVAKRLGLTVAWDDRQQGRARLVNLSAGRGADLRSILLKHDPRPERVQWAIAHEIGETLAERVFAALAIDASLAPRQAREVVANGMAARLLLPGQWFRADGNAVNWDLIQLKEIYVTASHELIARRMLDCGPQVIVAMYDQNRLTWRKSNSGFRMPKISEREIALRRKAHDEGQAVYDDGLPRISVWPVHEPHWKREIVRMEVDEFAAE